MHNSDLKQKYSIQVQTMLDKKYAELVHDNFQITSKKVWYILSSLISKTQRQLVLLLLPFSNPVFNNTQTFQHFVILFMWRSRNKRKLN